MDKLSTIFGMVLSIDKENFALVTILYHEKRGAHKTEKHWNRTFIVFNPNKKFEIILKLYWYKACIISTFISNKVFNSHAKY